MSDLAQQVQDAIDDFVKVAALAGRPIQASHIKVDVQLAPHKKPKGITKGEAAVYIFWHDDKCLKIGKAGPKSMPRYVHQHYNGLAPSTLTGTLKAELKKVHNVDLGHDVIGPWMMKNLDRVNIIIPYKGKEELHGLLEAFLLARFEPRFEGNRKKQPDGDTLLVKLTQESVRVKNNSIQA